MKKNIKYNLFLAIHQLYYLFKIIEITKRKRTRIRLLHNE